MKFLLLLVLAFAKERELSLSSCDDASASAIKRNRAFVGDKIHFSLLPEESVYFKKPHVCKMVLGAMGGRGRITRFEEPNCVLNDGFQINIHNGMLCRHCDLKIVIENNEMSMGFCGAINILNNE